MCSVGFSPRARAHPPVGQSPRYEQHRRTRMDLPDKPPADPVLGQRFPKRLRIKLKRDFDRVFRGGKSVSDSRLIVHAVANDLAFSRLGLSVGRRNGPAHERNRLKRWCREAYRTGRASLPAGYDFVVRVRPGAEVGYALIAESMGRLLPQAARRAAKGREP